MKNETDPIAESRRLYAAGRWRRETCGDLRFSLGPLGYVVVATLRRCLRGRRPNLVLDLGGGEGFIGSLVVGAENLVVIDAVEDAVRAARDRGARAVVGDVRRLPIKGGVADAVLSSDVLEHLTPADVPTAVEEMSRVLRSGGVALVHTSVYGFYLRRWLRWGPGRLDGDDLKDGHLSRLTAHELYSTFRRAGFAVEKYVFYKHFLQPLVQLLEDAAFGLIGEKKAALKAGKTRGGKRPGAFTSFAAGVRAVPPLFDLVLFGRAPGGASIFRLKKR
ncbi:MAG: methyltransferase domain-containing protein [Candidatus Coatesbacteria bacterium]|nr:MAG: methyltransferase domain-containing protein [Candidatus Coatesbacteria bacterium]